MFAHARSQVTRADAALAAAVRLAVAAVIAVHAAVGAAEVYRWTDANGRVQYSDKPPPGSAPAAVEVRPAPNELAGEWRYANATMNGELRLDEKLVGSTWTFGDSDLSIATAAGGTMRYGLRLQPGAWPKAFELTPPPGSTERGGWMLYERNGDRLRLAFFDNLGQRATNFEPARKKVVVTLIPASAAGSKAAAAGGDAKDPCSVLRNAGPTALFGDAPLVAKPEARRGTSCVLEQATGGGVSLTVVAAVTRAGLDRERERVDARDSARGAAQVRDEPELGAGAFSVARGGRTAFWAVKGDTLAVIQVTAAGSDYARIKAYVRRVLAGV